MTAMSNDQVGRLILEFWHEPDSVVYFARNPQSGHVKIGRTIDLRARLATLRTAIPDLELIGTISGGVQAERDLHAWFEDQRVAGEWFAPDLAMANTIGHLIRGARAAA